MVFLLGAALALAAACGRDSGASGDQAAGSAAASAASTTSRLENGDPMPPADQAGGVPPYPNAIVWESHPRPPSEFHTFAAFTPDTFLSVVAFYDRSLAEWRRTVAKDAVHYHLDPNVASVIVSPWNGEQLGEGDPRELREMRTSIGIAWKKDL